MNHKTKSENRASMKLKFWSLKMLKNEEVNPRTGSKYVKTYIQFKNLHQEYIENYYDPMTRRQKIQLEKMGE